MKTIDTAVRTAGATALAVLFVASVATVGCDKKGGDASPDGASTTATQPEAKPPEPLTAPHVPLEPGKFAPSLAGKVPEEHYDVDLHTDVQTCERCHAQIVEQWKDSTHAFASVHNPFFRVSFDDFVEDAGRDKAMFCSGCHDPALTFDGSITRELEPKDRRAHMGVSCNHCHGVVEATSDGNASYVLSTATIPLPKDGDPHSLAKHLARVGNETLRTNELCMSCHKNFLTPDTGHEVVIGGLNDATSFARSAYAGNRTSRIDSGVEEQNCVSCHMPKVDIGAKKVASHRFAGGHTTLARAIGSDAQFDAHREMIQNAATIDVAAVGVGDVKLGDAPTELKAGDRVWADVVVFNENTGHNFPAGARDLRDTWIEAVIEDADGNVVAKAGTDHAESGFDEDAVKLHALLSSKMGKMVETHRVHEMRAPIIDRTIEPRDALVARFVWTVPEGSVPKLPITVKSRLRHRRVHEPLAKKACEDSKTERGKAFAAQTKRYTGHELDACVEQPIVEIGEAWARIGDDERSNPDKPAWLRQYHRGLGLLHNVQESYPEAIEAFEAALAAVPADAPKVNRAQVVFQLGLVAAKQGRTQDAMDRWAEAEALVGEHPAIHFARGNAYQRVFRNDEATEWYEKAAAMVDDDRVWRQLAVSAAVDGKPEVSYRAAQAGLRHEQRDPHLLRNQMLAARKLDVSEEWKEAAKTAFGAYKRDEDAPNVRDRCSSSNPLCREEREPMRVVEMK